MHRLPASRRWNEWLLIRVQAQRWMTQIFEVDHGFIAVYKRRAARRLPERRGRLRQTEQTVQLGEHAHSAQPQRTVVVELSVQAELEGFDSGRTIFLRFFQFTYPLLECADDKSGSWPGPMSMAKYKGNRI